MNRRIIPGAFAISAFVFGYMWFESSKVFYLGVSFALFSCMVVTGVLLAKREAERRLRVR